MRPLTTLRSLGLLAAGGILIAACGGNAATTAPTTAAATTAPVTQAPAATPTEVPGATQGPAASLDLSSFHGDQDLEGMIPKSIGGETLTVLSMTGDQFLGDGSASPELAAALQSLNKTTSDLSVAFAGTSRVTVVAFRVKGVSAEALFGAFKTAQTDDYTAETVSFGGKSVTKITPADSSVAFIYITGDTMFVVGGAGGGAVPSDALLNEAFQKLP